MKTILIVCVLLGLLQSCTDQRENIDTIIERYDTSDFSELRNRSVHFRSQGHQRNTSIYLVNIYRGECPSYAVEFNDEGKSVVEIRNHLVLSNCGDDYLSRGEIEKAVKAYSEYPFFLLEVDKEGNVYINPNGQEGPPALLRVVPNSIPKDIDGFKLYKGNWYVRKSNAK